MDEIEVSQCYQVCPFFNVSIDGMECVHPYFAVSPPYANMIITHENSRGGVPDECPLRSGPVQVVKKVILKLEKI